jgi:hypothetical protein
MYFLNIRPGLCLLCQLRYPFQQKTNGLGGRAGIAFFADGETSFFTVPIVVNYLLGKNGKYFEVGAGITYYTFKSDTYYTFFNNRGSSSYDVGGVSYYQGASRDNGILGKPKFWLSLSAYRWWLQLQGGRKPGVFYRKVYTILALCEFWLRFLNKSVKYRPAFLH